MQELTGDIWELATTDDALVIPTNIGWKLDGSNVMGRGLARQAARRWPELPAVYGEFCQEHGAAAPIMIYHPPNLRWCKMLLMFPVKPLNVMQPYLSWRQDASIPLIEYHLPSLVRVAADHPGRILIPTIGCGNGQLDPSLVVPLLTRYLVSSRFWHVKYEDHHVEFSV